jgi:ArsR family transcriptional regulator, virulence genes transcriptional regulator
MIRNIEKSGQQDPIAVSQDQARLWEMQADICQTLANPKRLQIINLLKEEELSVGAMVKAMGVPKANLSQHLSVMRQKGILATRRDGTTIYYRLAIPYITEACAIMRDVLLDVLSARGKFRQSVLSTGKRAGAPEREEDR